MPPRAFIIAIENYPKAEGLANKLPDTNKTGNDFYEWFVKNKIEPLRQKHPNDPKLDLKELVVGCVDQPYEWRTTGTTADEILNEWYRFINKYKDKTEELYFFWSGHGFTYTDRGKVRAVNVLVTSDFISKGQSGRACLNLNEIQERTWSAMGPEEHYYFVDACRTTIKGNEINVSDPGYTFDPSDFGTPNVYTLYSTARGSAAGVTSGFADALVEGLKGSGRAKGWNEDHQQMYVKFDLLTDYVKKKIKDQTVDPKTDGSGKGVILELSPPFEQTCRITVNNAKANDKFTITAATSFGTQVFQFEGPSHNLPLRPFVYNIELSHEGSRVTQVSPPPPALLDLYEPCEVQFSLAEPSSAPPIPPSSPSSPGGTLSVSAPSTPHSEVEIENLNSGTTFRGAAFPAGAKGVPRAGRSPLLRDAKGGAFSGDVEPGTYMLRMRERGVVIGRRKVTVGPGEEIDVDLTERSESKVSQDILKVVSFASTQKKDEASANPDLSLWLSIIGAVPIVGSELTKQFPKVRQLALTKFADIAPGESAVYVLAAFEKSRGKFGVGLGQRVDWKPMRAVPDLTSVHQWRENTQPGPYLLSIQLPDQVPTTFATYCLSNRVTLMVFVEDEEGGLAVRQYMLPVSHLIDQLDNKVKGRIKYNPLSLVRYMSLVQTQFARKRTLEPGKNSSEQKTWQEVVYGKWIDPVMTLIAAYSFIRQGYAGPKASDENRKLLKTVITNLGDYFGELPDVSILEKLIKKPAKPLKSPPLLLDGVLGYEAAVKQVMPFESNQLNFSGPWTSWQGAVNSFE
jgi:hypothetical protein